MTHAPNDTVVPTAPRRPYEAPTVSELGTVAAVTAALSMQGSIKDGGPNNIKS